MKESDLYKPIRQWLESFGYNVFAEVPYDCGNCCIDVVALHPLYHNAVTVELKTGFTTRLAHQARHSLLTPFCYAAAPTVPRAAFMERARKLGIGVLRILPSDDVITLLKPRVRWKMVWKPYRQTMLQWIDDYGEHYAKLLGGVPATESGRQYQRG